MNPSKRTISIDRLNNINIIKDLMLILIGALLQGAAFAYFIAPANIVPGGVYGVAISTNHLTQGLFEAFPNGLPIGVTAMCFNIPFFILATRKLGMGSGWKTVITFIAISISTDLFMSFSGGKALVENDSFLASVYGGAIIGLSVFLIFKADSTCAGTDTLARILAKGNNTPTAHIILIIDSIVVMAGLLAFGDWRVPLYSLITIFVYSKVVEVMQPQNPNKAVFIVSNHPEKLRSVIIDDLDLRGTYLQGRGIYKGLERELIFMIIERKHLTKLKKKILEEDTEAFIATMNASNDSKPKLF